MLLTKNVAVDASELSANSKTFINEKDASQLSDQEIFKHIAAAEKVLEAFQNLKTKSKKKDAAIAKLKEDLAKMAEYLDNRP